MQSAPRFVVVLVAPENPLNVGFVARALKCNGVAGLRICSSNWSAVPDLAHRTGTSAEELLSSVRFDENLPSAIADCHRAIAFSRRRFDLSIPFFELGKAPFTAASNERIALVFGRESNGLSREELSFCNALCTIPTREGISYNLGQAVAIALYELVHHPFLHQNRAPDERPLLQEIEALHRWVESQTESPSDRSIARQLLQKMEPTRAELRAFFGLLKTLNNSEKPLRSANK